MVTTYMVMFRVCVPLVGTAAGDLGGQRSASIGYMVAFWSSCARSSLGDVKCGLREEFLVGPYMSRMKCVDFVLCFVQYSR